MASTILRISITLHRATPNNNKQPFLVGNSRSSLTSLFLPRRPPPRLAALTLSSSRRDGAVTSKKINRKKSTHKNVREDEDIEEDAFEALFRQLEEDLKNDEIVDDIGEDDNDDDNSNILEQEAVKLERVLFEALGDDDETENDDETGNEDEEDEEEDDDISEEELSNLEQELTRLDQELGEIYQELDEGLDDDDETKKEDEDEDENEEEEDDAIEELGKLEEELAELDQELARALEDDDETDNEDEEEEDDDMSEERRTKLDQVDEEEEEEEEEEETSLNLKNWQLKRLAYALKTGRRKTSIKTLAADLCLDRAVVLALLRDPPPKLVMLSATLPDKPASTVLSPEEKTVENVPLETMTHTEKPEVQEKLPIHVMQSNWSARKRLKKVQLETLEQVYKRTKRPTNAIISSIVHVTNLPRKKVVKWFEDKRGEEGVPERRLPYQRPDPESIFTS